MAGGGVGVCVNESAQGGGVISALQVIESGLFAGALANEAKNGEFGSRERLLKKEGE